MAEDWSLDVRKYVPNAEQGVIDAIVRYLGIALQKRDSSLVSFSDKTETDRVRENFLKKKLGLTAPDAELDAGIAEVGERMKGDRTKNRVTVYYLLAELFQKLSVFGGRDGIAGAGLGLAAGAGAAAAAAAAIPNVEPLADRRPAAAPAPDPQPAAFSARPGAGAGAAAAAAPAAGGFMRWLPWLIGAVILLGLLWWLFAGRQASAPVATTEPAPAVAETTTAAPDATVPPAPAATDATATAAAGALFPAKVFFANDSAAIPADGGQLIDRAASALKSEGGKVAVTAYTDRTGDLAHNQELAKNRAVAVRDALVKAGVPVGDIEMRPPGTVEIGTAGVMDADARRVEITRP